MSSVKMVSPRVSTVVMGEVEEQTWTTIAAEVDGIPQPDEIGQRMKTRRVHFAFRAEAEAWLVEQEANGWRRRNDPCSAATSYFGETDAPGNCWACEVEKELPDGG